MIKKDMRDMVAVEDWSIPCADLTEDEILLIEIEKFEMIQDTRTVYVSNEFLEVCGVELKEELYKAERVYFDYDRGRVYDFDASIDGCMISEKAVLQALYNGTAFYNNPIGGRK